jgi:hypothetical protein
LKNCKDYLFLRSPGWVKIIQVFRKKLLKATLINESIFVKNNLDKILAFVILDLLL